MSEQQGCTEVNYSRNLMFHGLGKEYFRLCIVNLLLTIVTLGIFAPWAFVRSKKYLYVMLNYQDLGFPIILQGAQYS